MFSESLARWWRQLHPGDNPLVRRWDRAEVCLLVATVLLALLAIPVFAAVGSTVYAQQLQIVADQQASRASAVAVLLDDAPAAIRTEGSIYETVDVRAFWTSADGAVREGKVAAPYGAKKGTEVDIWLDANGEPVSPPLTRVDAAALAIGAVAAGWLSFASVLAVVFWCARALLNRARYAEWDREWQHVSRDSIGP